MDEPVIGAEGADRNLEGVNTTTDQPPTSPPDRPGHRTRTSTRSSAITIALGVAAAASCLLLFAPAWGAGPGVWVTLALAVAAVGSGIFALEFRRVRSRGVVAAVVVGGAAGLLATGSALPLPDLEAHVYGYADCPILAPTVPEGVDPNAYFSAFYAPDFVGATTSTADPLPFDSALAVASTAAEGSEVLATFTIGGAIDVTEAAPSAVPPAYGTYLAVPVTMEAVNEGALSCMGWRGPQSGWVSRAFGSFPYVTISIPGYPTLEDGGVDNGDGTFTYYDIFDVPGPDGWYELVLLEPDGTIKSIYWGE